MRGVRSNKQSFLRTLGLGQIHADMSLSLGSRDVKYIDGNTHRSRTGRRLNA